MTASVNSGSDLDVLYTDEDYVANNDTGAPSNAPDTEHQWQMDLRRFVSGGVTTCQQWFRTKNGLWYREGSTIVGVVFTAWTSWVQVADYTGVGGGVTSVNGETGDVVLTIQAVGS